MGKNNFTGIATTWKVSVKLVPRVTWYCDTFKMPRRLTDYAGGQQGVQKVGRLKEPQS